MLMGGTVTGVSELPFAVEYHQLIVVRYELRAVANRYEINLQGTQRLVQAILVVRVKSRSAFIQNHNARLHVEAARKCNALLLACTQEIAPVRNSVEVGSARIQILQTPHLQQQLHVAV
jgi:hypothetical protein